MGLGGPKPAIKVSCCFHTHSERNADRHPSRYQSDGHGLLRRPRSEAGADECLVTGLLCELEKKMFRIVVVTTSNLHQMLSIYVVIRLLHSGLACRNRAVLGWQSIAPRPEPTQRAFHDSLASVIKRGHRVIIG